MAGDEPNESDSPATPAKPVDWHVMAPPGTKYSAPKLEPVELPRICDETESGDREGLSWFERAIVGLGAALTLPGSFVPPTQASVLPVTSITMTLGSRDVHATSLIARAVAEHPALRDFGFEAVGHALADPIHKTVRVELKIEIDGVSVDTAATVAGEVHAAVTKAVSAQYPVPRSEAPLGFVLPVDSRPDSELDGWDLIYRFSETGWRAAKVIAPVLMDLAEVGIGAKVAIDFIRYLRKPSVRKPSAYDELMARGDHAEWPIFTPGREAAVLAGSSIIIIPVRLKAKDAAAPGGDEMTAEKGLKMLKEFAGGIEALGNLLKPAKA